MSLDVIVCDSSYAKAWDNFVDLQPKALYCHRFEWSNVVRNAYGYSSNYLAALESNEIVGVFPVIVVPHLTARKQGISLAFSSYGGPLIRPGVDSKLILEKFFSNLNEAGISRVVTRIVKGRGTTSFSRAEVTMIRDLPSNEGLLWKEIGPKARNQIRKATKSGLSFSKEGNRIQDFYDIYTEKMYQLGTPVHSKRFFEEILEGYKNYSRIVTIKFQARTVGVMLLIHYRDTASDPFAATLPEFNHLCPSMLMYWEAMCDAIQRGLGRFDMGRSQYGSGTYLFKKQWGAEPYEIDYSVIDRNGSHSIENNFYRSHAALFLSKIWCQMPRVVQRNLGPKVRRFMA